MGEMSRFGTGMVATNATWAERMWDMLSDGGVWGIPRCGLMYRKEVEGAKFVLYARMPWEEGMPMTEEELREAQDSDHRGITVLFAVIGVTVTDETSAKSEGLG